MANSPRQRQRQREGAEPHSASGAIHARNGPTEVATQTILLIEDDAAIRAALATVLADHGFRVVAEADGYDALASLERQRPDVIVLDWMLTVVQGRQFIEALRSEYALTTPILVVTAARITVQEVLAAGANDLLRKPFDIAELVARIEALATPASERRSG